MQIWHECCFFSGFLSCKEDDVKRIAILVTAAALFALGTARADSVVGFNGDFAPANWTAVTGANGDAPVADASFLSISSPRPDDFVDDFTSFFISMTRNATVSFDWVYGTSDDSREAIWDPFGIITDDGSLFTQLTDDFGDINQFGSHSVVVSAGETFGFSAWALDGDLGTATTRISNFRVDYISDVPEPQTLLLLGIALATAATVRRRSTSV
jgi:hypothetical protein